ncbi:hypothetical protein [Ekhidna sp.]|uniref:hypothetical protein n=1 Tax=Ekhidna sp. TaxID=2608089 RepID=UPI003C7C693A
MELKRKNILIVSPEPWEHIFVSKHHYATHLALRGNNIVFLNPPSEKFSIKETEYQNLKVCDYKGFWKGLRLYPKTIRAINQRKVLSAIERISKLKFDIIWSFDNSVFFDFDALPQPIFKISHIVDLNQDFQTKNAAKSADVCIGVTREIVKRLKYYNPNSHFINHGLNVAITRDIPVDLPGDNKTKVLYVGNLAMKYLDWHTLYLSIKMYPESDFIFIGPNADDCNLTTNETHQFKKLCSSCTNVYFLKPIKSEEIQSYLNAGDVLIICYQEKYHSYQANAHKILEYLYSGKPVLASYSSAYEGLDLLYMGKKNESMVYSLGDIVADLKAFNTKDDVNRRKEFALENTYEKQIQRIEKLI